MWTKEQYIYFRNINNWKILSDEEIESVINMLNEIEGLVCLYDDMENIEPNTKFNY